MPVSLWNNVLLRAFGVSSKYYQNTLIMESKFYQDFIQNTIFKLILQLFVSSNTKEVLYIQWKRLLLYSNMLWFDDNWHNAIRLILLYTTIISKIERKKSWNHISFLFISQIYHAVIINIIFIGCLMEFVLLIFYLFV
jgi:hypothetical protein